MSCPCKPKVSIITPSFNQGNYLEDTILSVAAQSYPNIEYIIIDGGSQDQSLEVINKYKNKLAYWSSEKDKGQSHAINKGLKIASGDILTWLNSDDQLLPDAVRKAVSLFQENPQFSVVHGKVVLFRKDGWEQVKGPTEEDLQNKYLSGMPFSQPSSFFRKNALESVGFLNEDLHYGMDYDFFVRMALQGDILKSDFLFSKYLLHDESKTTTSSLRFADEWAKIFSQVMCSIGSPASGSIIGRLKELELYHEEEQLYKVFKTFSKDFIEKSFLFFLGNQMTFRYEGLDLKGVRRIGNYLEENDPQFLRKFDYNTMYKRALIPAPFIQLSRKLIR